MSRAYGSRVVEVLEVLQGLGAGQTIVAVHAAAGLSGVSTGQVATYLHRAERYKLVVVDRKERPHKFSVVDNWKEAVDKKKPRYLKYPVVSRGTSVVLEAMMTQPVSVFDVRSK